MQGYCSELGKYVIVNREEIDSSTLEEKSFIKGLLDCKNAQNCRYLKQHHKCELE